MEGRDTFLASGGEEYRYIACLNESPAFIAALTDLCMQHMQGWPTSRADAAARAAEAEQGRARARAVGSGTLGRQAPAAFRKSANAATARCR